MRYVCKVNFNDGKDKGGNARKFKAGQEYTGARAEEFLAKGFIADADAMDAQSVEELKAAIAKKQEELSALTEKLAKLEASAKQPSAAPGGEANGAGEGQESGNEQGDDKPQPPPGLSGKALKKWKEENGVE